MSAVIVVPVGNSFQHADLKAYVDGGDVARLAKHLNTLDDDAFAAVTPAATFHSWPSLKSAVEGEHAPCRFLLVGTEQSDGLQRDRGRDSEPLFVAVARFLSREFAREIMGPYVVIHPKHSLRELVLGLQKHQVIWAAATSVYILGGATRHVQEALAVAVPAMVHSGCPVLRPNSDREAHHGWEALSASDADNVPMVALLLRSLELDLTHLAEAILEEPGEGALLPEQRTAFEAAMRTPMGSTVRLALIEAWSRSGE